ncbi:unnamed protein product [Gongylonema pulchrum]|uniref:UMA domain-containing protein n=1 Tax=Gongylonema pulchrum TaxID=637853 RepID=A0A183DYP8_9BILA|nr:unnamed protein product [Gongylonema pulchrum]
MALLASIFLHDYIADVYMDISHEFFPLPTVVLPDVVLKRPTIPEYSFESEKKAIAEYAKNRAALTSKLELRPPAEVVKKVENNVDLTKRPPNVAAQAHMYRFHSCGILEPSRVVATTSKQQQSTKPVKPAMNIFEEFEAKPNLFDLLELRTIDDKAALEQILANPVPPPPPPAQPLSASGSSTQSFTTVPATASNTSVGLKALNMPRADDVLNMYNLQTALESHSNNNSYGFGIPGASSSLQNL